MKLNFVLIVGQGESIPPNSLARGLCKVWNKNGHKITLSPCIPVKGDVGLLHIDATKISPDVLSGFDTDMPIWNRHALDISKRRVSHNLVGIDDRYTGTVVVKTDDNAFGGRQFPVTQQHLYTLKRRRQTTIDTWMDMRVLPLNT